MCDIGYHQSLCVFVPHRRSAQVNINDDVTYTVAVNTLYKEEPNVEYAEEISIVTGGNGALCGAWLQLHEEYLIGLFRSGPSIFNPSQDGQLRFNVCGLVRVWSSVTDEEEAALEAGCDDGLCDGACSDFQVQGEVTDEVLGYQVDEAKRRWHSPPTLRNIVWPESAQSVVSSTPIVARVGACL